MSAPTESTPDLEEERKKAHDLLFEFHGCTTGDCPHDDQVQCFESIFDAGWNSRDDLEKPIPPSPTTPMGGADVWIKRLIDVARNYVYSVTCRDNLGYEMIPMATCVDFAEDMRSNLEAIENLTTVRDARSASNLRTETEAKQGDEKEVDTRLARIREIIEADGEIEPDMALEVPFLLAKIAALEAELEFWKQGEFETEIDDLKAEVTRLRGVDVGRSQGLSKDEFDRGWDSCRAEFLKALGGDKK